MAITLKNIQELVEGNAQSTSPIIFGDNTTLKRTTIQEIIDNFVNQGISSLNVNNTSSQYTFFETNGQIAVPSAYNVVISTDVNELRFYTVNIVDTATGVASLRNYLFEPNTNQNLLTRLNSPNSVLISSQLAEITTANTVTYNVADLDEINNSVNGFDFTNTDTSYFVQIGSSLYAFQGQNGTYGDGELQIDFDDLILVSGFQTITFDQETKEFFYTNSQGQTTTIDFKKELGSQLRPNTNTIGFDWNYIYGSASSPLSGALSITNTNARLGYIQKIYHDDSTAPSFPASFKVQGEGEYLENASAEGLVNTIFVEWSSSTRQVYWITQEEV